MQIHGVQSTPNISITGGSQSPLEQLSPGDVIQAQVVSAEQGTVTLQLPHGQQLDASQRTMDFLQPGDSITLMVTQSGSQAGHKLELLSVNGQPVNAQASSMEYTLMEMRIAPTQANLAVAAALGRMGAPLQPETFARMSEFTAKFPNLPVNVALAFASSSLPIDQPTVESFAQWLQSPAQATEFVDAALTLASSDPQAASILQDAAAQLLAAAKAAPQQQPLSSTNLPDGLSPKLALQLQQNGAWQELTSQLPKLPPQEAQGRILQLMSDLPINTSSQERSIIYNALAALRSPAPAQPTQETQQAQHTQQAQQTLPADQPANLPQGITASQPLPQQSQLASALSSLFAALSDALPGESGSILKQAAASFEHKLTAFNSSLKGVEDPTAAAKLKPVLELGQAIVTQVQMGSELGNLMYLPLPVALNQTQQDAALYILKRNGGSKVDDSNATIAICLETQHLGAVDTLLKVERNDLTLQFRVDTPEAKNFFKPRLAAASRLNFPSQYQFRGATVVLKDTPITPSNAGQVMQNAFGIPAATGLDISI